MSNNLFINSNDSSHLFCSSTNEYTEQLIHRRINFTQTKFNKHLQYLVDYVTCLILQVNNVIFLSKMIFLHFIVSVECIKVTFEKISENFWKFWDDNGLKTIAESLFIWMKRETYKFSCHRFVKTDDIMFIHVLQILFLLFSEPNVP